MNMEGFYGDQQAETTAQQFLTIQHRDFHSELQVKPDRESVDNQAASLGLLSAEKALRKSTTLRRVNDG